MSNKTIFRFSFLLSVGLLTACAPVYKCGEARPAGFAAGNRLMAVVNERDQLCEEVSNKEADLARLAKENSQLNLEKDTLNKIIGLRNNTIDSMTTANNSLNHKIDQLNEEIGMLNNKNLNLRQQYSQQVTDNLNQGHLFDERLKEKERNLALKEQELATKEQELAKKQARIDELEKEIARRDSLTQHLNNMLKQALLGFDSDELSVEVKNGKVYVSMSDKLMFQSGKADVQAKGKQALISLANVLKKDDNFEIQIEGHTDNVPIHTALYKDNWDLSTARANAVLRILQKDGGLDPHKLLAAGKGEYEPCASNDTAEGRAKNRRTEIILSPNLSGLMNYLEK